MPGGAVLASLANARGYRANPVAFYRGLTGPTSDYRAVAAFDFFGPNLLVNDPELVGAVLTSPSGVGFGKDGLRFFTVLRRMLGDGLFTVEGPPHNSRRRALQPILRSLDGCAAAAMTAAASRLRDEWSAGPSRSVDVQEAAGRTALHLLAAALVGPAHADMVCELGYLFERAEAPLLRVLEAPVVFPAWLPTPGNRRLRRASDALRRRALELLSAPDIEPGSLLGRIRRQVDDGLLDELVTLVVAGHQSTAAAIAFSLYLLAAHPSASSRVAAEAAAVLGDRPATMADLPALPYTAAVVAESIRLYPPVWIITRRVVSAGSLDGYGVVPAGAVIHICPHTLHRNPAHWPSPDRFSPDRFLSPGGRHRFAYAPFGAGPHKCIGNHFALAATAIVLATLAPAVRFAPPASEPRVGARSFTVAEGGLPLVLLRP